MFIRFFKSSFFIQYLAIGVVGSGLWLSAFLNPAGMPAPDGPVPLYSLVYQLFHDLPLLATLVGFCLVLIETYLFTRILSTHELVLKNSSLSALVFIVMMSSLPDQLTLNPINIALGFMILILHHLLISYNKPEHLDRIFAAGLFTAIASMVYLPFILWFVFVIISFLVFRAGNWRAWMAAFIGLVTPYLYLAVWYFWHDEFMERVNDYAAFFSHLRLFPVTFPIDFYLLGGFTLLLAFWGILLFRNSPERTVEIRVKTNILLWTLLFATLSFFYSGSMAVLHTALAIPAIAMVITVSLIGLRKNRLAETLLLLYFAGILLNNMFFHNMVNH